MTFIKMLTAAFCLCAMADAATITFTLPGQASATITTGLGTISVQLTDLVVNPGAVTDNLSAFSFTADAAPGTVSIASSSSSQIDVASDGSYTSLGATSTLGWALSVITTTTTLDVLSGTGHLGPSNTLIGSPDSNNIYSNANSGIAGNVAHNPFLFETATWTLNASNVTANTNITGAIFQFGTTDGTNQFATTPLAPAPEPSSLGLFAFGAIMLFAPVLQRRWRQR